MEHNLSFKIVFRSVFILICLQISQPPSLLGFFKDDEDESLKISKGYLSFHSPPKLRFAKLPIEADRSSLLLLSNSDLSVEMNEIPENNTSSDSDFPIISYTDEENNESAIYSIPSDSSAESASIDSLPILPPADPFLTPQDDPLSSVNTTDELMRVFEKSDSSSNPRVPGGFQFFPPFTVDRGNLTIGSKATYTRKQR